jgi:hypothetical protein
MQWKSNSNYRTLQAPPSRQSATVSTTNTNMSFFAFELPFLYSSYNILLPIYIQCLQRPWPPIVCCQLVSHNTQTNKVSYLNSQVFSKQSLQPLTNSDNINSTVCTKKVDDCSKQKPKP